MWQNSFKSFGHWLNINMMCNDRTNNPYDVHFKVNRYDNNNVFGRLSHLSLQVTLDSLLNKTQCVMNNRTNRLCSYQGVSLRLCLSDGVKLYVVGVSQTYQMDGQENPLDFQIYILKIYIIRSQTKLSIGAQLLTKKKADKQTHMRTNKQTKDSTVRYKIAKKSYLL